MLLAIIVGKYIALRNVREPVLLNIGFTRTDEPDVIFCGIVPTYAANCLAFIKVFISGILAKISIAESSPIHGIVNRS